LSRIRNRISPSASSPHSSARRSAGDMAEDGKGLGLRMGLDLNIMVRFLQNPG